MRIKQHKLGVCVFREGDNCYFSTPSNTICKYLWKLEPEFILAHTHTHRILTRLLFMLPSLHLHPSTHPALDPSHTLEHMRTHVEGSETLRWHRPYHGSPSSPKHDKLIVKWVWLNYTVSERQFMPPDQNLTSTKVINKQTNKLSNKEKNYTKIKTAYVTNKINN